MSKGDEAVASESSEPGALVSESQPVRRHSQPAPAPLARERPRVFLSHRNAGALAKQIASARVASYGIEVWFDGWEIGPGDDIVDLL
jgi:hypothetical protein